MPETEEKEKPETIQTHYTNVTFKLAKADLIFEFGAPAREFVRQLNNAVIEMPVIADALQKFGEEEIEVTQISASYQVQPSDKILFVSAVSGAVVISLLSLGVAPVGSRLLIIRLDNTDNTVTITPVSGETIEGASTLALTAQYQKANLVNALSTWVDLRGSELI